MNKRTTPKARHKARRKSQAPRKTAGPAKATAAAQPPAAAPKKQEVKITAAKGRPMLTWVGKRPLAQVTAFPAQLAERHNAIAILGMEYVGGDVDTADKRMKVFRSLSEHWNAKCWEGQPGIAVPESGGLLFHGDNKEVLAHLLANGYRGKADLIYIDPPFDSGADYVRKVSLRGAKGEVAVEGESYSLGEQIQYSDIWANDNYLQFMYERLLLLKELLAPSGSLYLHCDYRRMHLLRCLLDEIFGPENHLNSLVWMFSTRSSIKSTWKRSHNDILFYKKCSDPLFNWDDEMVLEPLSQATIDKYRLEDENGRYRLSGRNIKGSPIRSQKDVDPSWEKTHPEWVVRDYLRDGKAANDFFFVDIENQASSNRTDYPTQKPEELLYKLIGASTRPGDLVLDCFIGSGTTAAVAQKLGRRWIGCDINKGAIQTTTKRLRAIISEQIAQALADKKEQAGTLPGIGDGEQADKLKPCQFGFAVWRVNDYDLQIQHNEAVNLACEHIGIQRTRTDSYFEGTLGRKLVKIVPFGHPLTPLDLEELRRELDARPDEDRGITLVCLGMELEAKAWIETWNRLRKGKQAVNRIEVIELRTDPKYGKFIQHRPGQAKVKIARKGRRITVEFKDFISPTIIERLQQQAGLLQPKIDNWRAMVDCVCIDTAYTGGAFNVVLADVPEKKADFVSGQYDLPAPEDATTVAVRITDMLGEEVLVTAEV